LVEISKEEIKGNAAEDYSKARKKLFRDNICILIVDDEAFNVFVFRLLFKKYPTIIIDEAYNGE